MARATRKRKVRNTASIQARSQAAAEAGMAAAAVTHQRDDVPELRDCEGWPIVAGLAHFDGDPANVDKLGSRVYVRPKGEKGEVDYRPSARGRVYRTYIDLRERRVVLFRHPESHAYHAAYASDCSLRPGLTPDEEARAGAWTRDMRGSRSQT